MAAHVDHVAQMVGPRHVGLGLDFLFMPEVDDTPPGVDRGYWWPPRAGYDEDGFHELRMVEPEQLPGLTERLLSLGYGEADVRGSWAGISCGSPRRPGRPRTDDRRLNRRRRR